jgi:drug/metabolite transporter (DMT)-like permease
LFVLNILVQKVHEVLSLNERTLATIKGGITILLWSFSALFISFTPEIPPFLLACLTSAAGFLLFSFRWLGDYKRLINTLLQPARIWLLFAVAVIAYRGFYISGLKTTSTLEANLINYLWPVFIVLFAALIDKRRISVSLVLASLISFVGVFCIGISQSGGVFDWQLSNGHLLALLAAICWSGYSVATKRITATPNDMIGVMHLMAAVIFYLFHHFFEVPVIWQNVDLLHWLAVFQLGVAISLGYSWWDIAMTKGNQQQIAIGANFIPLLSTFWLILLGRQNLTYLVLIAAVLILSGSYLAKRSQT